ELEENHEGTKERRKFLSPQMARISANAFFSIRVDSRHSPAPPICLSSFVPWWFNSPACHPYNGLCKDVAARPARPKRCRVLSAAFAARLVLPPGLLNDSFGYASRRQRFPSSAD